MSDKSDFIETINRNKRAFTIYNLFKTQLCLREFAVAQKDAFQLIPCLLHTSSITAFNNENGFRAPSGIYNFIWSGRISHLLSEYFPGEKIDLSTVQNPAPIEFLSLMGSVGSIAYTDKSDFDYWVCIRNDVTDFERARLEEKLLKIEAWSLEYLKVEVHFFVTTSISLRDNNYGSVTSESCGSALGKLLKEEYYRGSLLISGKIPLWWGLPIGVDDELYKKYASALLKETSELSKVFVDIGNVHRIPQGEFLGGGLWQLNKSISSPFKSVLKMALLIEYSDESSQEVLVSTQTKKMIFDNPSAMRHLDPYQNMLDRILAYYKKNGTKSELHLMRQCFFLKIKPKVSRWLDSPLTPPRNVDAIMVKYCKEWGWGEREVMQCEEFDLMPLKEALKLKRRCEAFMQKSLLKLESMTSSRKINLSISDVDRTKMINRLHSVYDDTRSSTNIFYPPFRTFIEDHHYSIKKQVNDTDIDEWLLFKGKENKGFAVDTNDDMSLLNRSNRFSELVLWLTSNSLIKERTVLNSPLTKKDFFQRNIRNLVHVKKHFFRQSEILSFEEADFSLASYPMQWMICIDMVPSELGEESEIKSEEKMAQPKSTKSSSFTKVLHRIAVEEKDRSSEEKKGDVIKMKTFLPKHIIHIDATELRKYKLRKLRNTDDPINAWSPKFSLIRNAILLEKNSWGEYSTHEFHDSDWLARVINHVFNRAFEKKINLRSSIDFFIGNGLYKSHFLDSRFEELLQNLTDFFDQDFDQTNDQVRVFYYEKGGWIYTVIQQKLQVNIQSFDCWLKAMMSINVIFPNVNIESGFDSWSEQGQFYGIANAMRKPDLISVFLLDNPDIVYLLVIDENGCCSANEIPRKELSHYLPKFIFGVVKSMQMVRSHVNPELFEKIRESFEVNWITIGPKGNVYTQDITESTVAMMNKYIQNMGRLNAEITHAHVRLFMLQFAYQLEASFRDKKSQKIIYNIIDQVKKFRSDARSQSSYDIFLTGIDVENIETGHEADYFLPSSVSGWLNLKLALEYSCLKLLDI